MKKIELDCSNLLGEVWLNVGITQRVDYIQSYGENRDCLDQRWYEFLRLNVFHSITNCKIT